VVDRVDAEAVAGAAAFPPPAPPTTDAQRCEWRFSSTAASVRGVRQALRPFLTAAHLPAGDLDDLVLAACEAAANAIEHAQGSTELFFDVRAEIDGGGVLVEIRDYGRWKTGLLVRGERGQGLRMMTMLAAVTVLSGPLGTSVTLRNVQ
jgi:anti-sigma regulatory factor (Ser/Thr protein kinase)